jgi:hypothetical protein
VAPGISLIRRVSCCLILTAAIAVAGSAYASSAPRPVQLLPGTSSVAGRGYSQWLAASWRWRLLLPNSAAHEQGERPCLRSFQRGPVWFLGWSGVATHIACAIPAGRYVIYQPISVDCSTVEPAPFHASTDAGLRRCAQRYWRAGGAYATLILDRRKLKPSEYVRSTNAFAFRMPSRDNYLGAAGRTHGRIAVTGMSAIIPPLSAGKHTLVASGGLRHGRPARFPTVTITLSTR